MDTFIGICTLEGLLVGEPRGKSKHFRFSRRTSQQLWEDEHRQRYQRRLGGVVCYYSR